MSESASMMITLGSLFLVGLAGESLAFVTRLPRVTLLLALGILTGPHGFDLLVLEGHLLFPTSAHMALAMVGFLLGERFVLAELRKNGTAVLWISLAAVLTTAAIVALGLLLVGAPPALALLLGAISTSTDPAATADVVDQEATDNDFSRTLLGVVALDDVWGLMLFGLLAAMAGSFSGDLTAAASVGVAVREVGGAVALGALLGLPLALLAKHVEPGSPTLLEALGAVFLCGGLALWLDVSPLLASMVLGAVVANGAQSDNRPFHAIESIERPFLVLFFLLAGALLDLRAFGALETIGAVYVIGRASGRWTGGFLGATAARASPSTRRWMGLALMPQAGVALGLAVIAGERFPELQQVLLSTVIGSTVLFELLGPLGTRHALRRHAASEPGADRAL